MKTFIKRFIAIANLGVYFWIHMAKLAYHGIFSRNQPDPVDTFVTQFADDKLFHLPENEVDGVLAMQQCIGCGLCRLAGGDAAALPRRELRDFSQTLDASGLRGMTVKGLNALCPVNVPLEQLQGMMESYKP